MSDRESDLGAFLSGVIIGGLVGAAAALLLAPQSGEETRAIIKERSIELKDRAAETAEEARHRAEMAAIEARHRAEEIAHQARERADDAIKRGQDAIDHQVERFNKGNEEPPISPAA
jgi:gas vesicle protein